MGRTAFSLPVMLEWRHPMSPHQHRDMTAMRGRLPALPAAGGKISVIQWAQDFLTAYSYLLERQGLPDQAEMLDRIQYVLSHLGNSLPRRRQETEAYEQAAEHYDQLIAANAPDYLKDSMQLVLLLLLAVDQLRKIESGNGVSLNIAGIEEVVNAKRQY